MGVGGEVEGDRGIGGERDRGGLTPPEVAAPGTVEDSIIEVGIAEREDDDSIIEARELLKEDPAESAADRVSEAGSEVGT